MCPYNGVCLCERHVKHDVDGHFVNYIRNKLLDSV